MRRARHPAGVGLAALLLLSAAAGCSFKPSAGGIEGGLVVVADDLDRPVIRRAVEGSFGKVIHTPQPETWFDLQWIDAGRIGEFTRAPLLLMAVTLDGTGPTAELLKRMLTPEIESGLREGEYEVFRRYDPWARGQMLLIVVGRSQRELGARMHSLSDSLVSWALDFERRRLMKSIYARGEQKETAKELESEFGFSVRVQHDYFRAESSDSLCYFRLLRRFPERWLTFFWGELQDSTQLTPQFIFERRQAAGNTFADPVFHYDDRMSWETVSFLGRRALLVRGLWATVGPAGGGPFFSYGLFISREKRYYIIDGACFAPGESKVPFLWQLDVIAHTFSHKESIGH